MDTLPVEFRNQLAAVIKAARRAGESCARSALDVLAVGEARAHASMSPADQHLRRRLRAHGRQLGDRRNPATGAQQIERLAHEVACEHWHRMLFARFLAENQLLIEPESGVAVSLAECEELAQEQGQGRWTLAGRFAERMLPGVFRSRDPALEAPLAPEARQELQRLLESLPASVFTARDALGWTYQFWQAERKDAVNKSGIKIGAEELPAVTQLFTERYMVLFLLHNTVGAWRAGRILAENPEQAATAASEDELRRAVRLEAHGGYDFAYLRFVREPRDGDAADRPSGPWRPAAGAFAGWPQAAAELRVLDPCCGSGHFLVECLDLLVRLRMAEERLAPPAAVDAVLRDNLFGLEIDPRCTQIAAFNLALAAWTWPGTGGYRPLPPLSLACNGVAPNAARDDWTRLAAGSVVWDEETKHATHGPRRIDATVLQVAVARLLGYRWPAEQDPDMRLAGEMRTWVERCRSLDPFADADGIVCLAPVSRESAAAKIMAGEPPCDLFVRWMPLGGQPIGWEPDSNDGVRLNIRPFMSAELTRGGRAGAGILRTRPQIWTIYERGGGGATKRAAQVLGGRHAPVAVGQGRGRAPVFRRRRQRRGDAGAAARPVSRRRRRSGRPGARRRA